MARLHRVPLVGWWCVLVATAAITLPMVDGLTASEPRPSPPLPQSRRASTGSAPLPDERPRGSILNPRKDRAASSDSIAVPVLDTAARVEEIAAQARSSVVVVTMDGRDGEDQSLGSGFVISPDGLLVTNLHVIGDSRPISVQFQDGREFPVVSVHATDKVMDLAILKIDATGLPALELGSSETLPVGATVVAIGNPLGLRHSVVSGVVSEKREVENRPMLQLAIPIERGNSGGPVLDLDGRVQGIVTLKSLIKTNLGFAVVADALQPLLEQPNPVPMNQWVKLGALNPQKWKTLFGANWRQRAGRILVDGSGDGFGARSLCLSTAQVPELPFEVQVQVRFTPEDGAAGLVFHADGGDLHYGFYPSNGRLRLSRFNGPDVYSWKVLAEVASDAYLPNEWNTLKVRVEAQRLLCFVNGEQVVESTDTVFKSGLAGLAKFRKTSAEFRNFIVAPQIDDGRPGDDVVQRISELVADLPVKQAPVPKLVSEIAPTGSPAMLVLRDEAELLEQRARRLRELARAVHSCNVQTELASVVNNADGPVDLLRASLLIARLDNEEVVVDEYLAQVDDMVADIRSGFRDGQSETERLNLLNKHLFEQLGYHGSRTNYYHRSNSYMNEVLDDREGLPITLSVLYMEVARRLGLNVVGVGLPGHFVVRHEPSRGEAVLLDVFDGARVMPLNEAHDRIRERLRPGTSPAQFEALTTEFLQASPPDSIVIRMLTNLRGAAESDEDKTAVLRYLDAMLAVRPDDLPLRVERIDLQIRERRLAGAIDDIDWMLDRRPEGLDINGVMQLRADLESRLTALEE